MPKARFILAASLLLAGILSAIASATVYVRPIVLNGANEVPADTMHSSGSGTITIDDVANTVSWDINQDVVGSTNSHIHGPAPVGVNAGIIRPLHTGTVPGHMTGTYTIGRTPTDTLRWILHDSTYVNVHSTALPGGEIRGQIFVVAKLIINAITLNGASEVPANNSAAKGSGFIAINTTTNQVSWDINQNVANATLSHIHGPAAPGVNAGVIRPLHTGNFFPPHMTGTYTIGRTPVDTLAMMINYQTYVNIHSLAFGGGEIRGQISGASGILPSLSQWGIILLSLTLVAAAVLMLRRRRTA